MMENLLKEVNVFGVFVPPMFVYMLIALLIWGALRRLLEAVGFYNLVAHRNLFNYAGYAIILSIVTTVILTLCM